MTPTILVVDDERTIGIAIQRLLSGRGCQVETAQSAEEAIEKLGRTAYHLLITDLNLRTLSGMDLLRWVKVHTPETAVIMITAYGSEKIAVEAMKLGASDYLPKPFDNDELELIVQRVLEGMTLRRDLRLLQEQVAGTYRFENILGKSAAMQRVFEVIRKVTDTDLTVLIRGPSGTGKELVANALHYNSPRRARPLVKVNCAAFSRELVESELFGHEKGAFTGALSAREGKFEVADGGTLFLDEIGDLRMDLQAKLLRAIQEGEIERVGGTRPIKTEFRLIAATNVDLEKAVKEGRFREDLYYRINVIPIKLPPLRERTDDIPQLADFFIRRYNTKFRKHIQGMTDATMAVLQRYWWPGNIRELENLIERLVAVSDKDFISEEDLPLEFHFAQLEPTAAAKQNLFEEATNTFERNFILRALEKSGWSVTAAAEYLGIPLSTLKYKMDRLEVREFAKRLRGA